MLTKTRAVAVSLVLVLVGGCAARGLTLGTNDDGGSFALASGGELTVELPSNPSTGYGWQVVGSSLGGVLESGGASEFVADSSLVGAAGIEKLHFRAAKAGSATLRLEYKRPWETTATPEKTYAVTVEVR